MLVDGAPAPALYRWYRIRSPAVRLGRSDDCASLAEMIAARFAAAAAAAADGASGAAGNSDDGGRVCGIVGGTATAKGKRLPDLLLIDGGKGQVCVIEGWAGRQSERARAAEPGILAGAPWPSRRVVTWQSPLDR